jgi:hypothetical protein
MTSVMVKKNGECLQSWPFSAIVYIIFNNNNIELNRKTYSNFWPSFLHQMADFPFESTEKEVCQVY